MKRATIIGLTAVFVILLAAPASAEEAAKAEEPGKSDTLKWAESQFHYVGEKKCKTCHKKQYKSWKTTAHAKAWSLLEAEEQKKAECAGCHSIGLNKSDSLLVNVGCEACHGPGEKYKKMKTMKNAKLATAAGLLPITEETCIRCHNKKSPKFKGFKYAEALKKGVHEHFEPKKKKATK